MAPSKTFNIAGFATSEIIIENETIRNKFRYITQSLHICGGNILGDAALIASYSKGKPWLRRTLKFLKENIEFVKSYIEKNIPEISVIEPESTFLLWLDCRNLKMEQKELQRFFVDDAGLGLNDGEMFGENGKGFMRMNIGTCRRILKKALIQLKKAVDEKKA
jgi:cystathionine beta-lyase